MSSLGKLGNLSSSWSIINSSSKFSLADDRRPLAQHFFLKPGVDEDRWKYPQPWTQGAFHNPHVWWNIYFPSTYLHAISKVLVTLTAARCADLCSQTPGSSLATARCAGLCSWTPGSSLATACCADSCSWTPGSSLATARCADSCSRTPGSSLNVEWQNGGMAEWQNGGMAEWRNGGMVFYYIPNLSCYIYGTCQWCRQWRQQLQWLLNHLDVLNQFDNQPKGFVRECNWSC
jgi:hypothetical protein